MRFFDASAIVKRYLRETGSARVRQWLAAGPVAISRLSEVEVASAFERLAREGRLSTRGRDRARAAFVTDLGAWHIVELTEDVTALARGLLARHSLRTGDAIQLAAALVLQRAIERPLDGFAAFDERLVSAARSEQLTVLTSQPRRRRRPARVLKAP